MITIYELERKTPKYYGLCGLVTESTVMVHEHYPFDITDLINKTNHAKSLGWKVVKIRKYPIKGKTQRQMLNH